MIPHYFKVREDKFAMGSEEPRFRGVYLVEEIGGSYRGWYAKGFAAAVSLAGIYAIGAGSASDVIR